METVYFLIFVGIFAFIIFWGTGASKRKTDLVAKHKARQAKQTSVKLATPMDSRLSHNKEIWEARRNRAARANAQQTFIPKSEAKAAPEYDGYSRRDRHHVTPSGLVKKEKHIDDVDEFKVRSVKFDSRKQAAQS